MAGVLAHELAHSLTSYVLEDAFNLSNILFCFFLMFALNDVFITPLVQNVVDTSRRLEMFD